jgi:hypothetical protein
MPFRKRCAAMLGDCTQELKHAHQLPRCPETFAQMQGSAQSAPCELEVKHGLCSIAETLHFMHTSCRLAHCNLSPESIIIAADGTWKLAGMCFATPISPNGAQHLPSPDAE